MKNNNIKHNYNISAKGFRGFTVIELMIVLSIATILTSVGVPTMITAIHNSQVRTTTQDLFASFHLARSEAIKRNSQVTVAAVSGNWANGWTITSGLDTIRTQDPIAALSFSGTTSIVYNTDGRPTNSSTATIQVSKADSQAMIKCVSLSSSMRATVLSDKDFDGDCTNG